MRLFLIRHPRPDIPPGICYGRSDVAVTPDERARALANLLPMLPATAKLYTSPARRCAEFADDLAKALSIESVRIDGRLREMDFGAWEMQDWSAIAQAEVDAWAADLTSYRPGGGESVLEAAQRVRAFFDDLRQEDRHKADVIVVCHAGTIRLLRECLLPQSIAAMALQAARSSHGIAYGECVVLNSPRGIHCGEILLS